LPSPVVPWVQYQPLTAKALNISLYTSDGTADNTTGISFATWRPALFEAYNTALTLHTSSGGSRSTLASTGSLTSCWVVFDSAGYFGQTQDLPAYGYYQFTPVVEGSTGDGINAGGWYLVAHFAPLTSTSSQTSVGADLLQNGAFLSAGTRQKPTSANHGCPFFFDLINAGTNTFAPAALVGDSSSANCSLVVNSTDSSGETPRSYAIWAGISASSAGEASWDVAGTYTWFAPDGVTEVTVAETGGGGGGGAGNSSSAITGGGGGGGAEFASGVVAVTPGDPFPVTVGAGGTGGAAAGDNGSNGGVSTFTGLSSLTAHGGSFGAGATTAASGAGGAGGTGSGASTHFSGGAGATGSNNKYGGGGGSSGGTTSKGNAASSAAAAPAVPGGGPGGAGGAPVISVVQTAHGSANGNALTVSLKGTQAGNTILAFVYYQATGGTLTDPVVALNDGTALTSRVEADVTSNVNLQVRLFDVYAIPGGETSITITGSGSSDRGVLAEIYEVSGLGASPAFDIQSTHTQGPSHPDVNYQSWSGSAPPSTTKAPELWVAMTGGQQIGNFTVQNPAGSEGWTVDSPHYVTTSGTYSNVTGAILTAHQIKTATGAIGFSGLFSTGVTKGTMAVSYVPGAATVGQSPPVGPGGGGGGGYNQNAGANGSDGQVTLTWTTSSNSNYGTGNVPAPLAAWNDTTPVTAALLNGNTGVAGVVNFLANPPVLRAHATTTQSIANSTAATVALGVVDTDTYSGWNSSTNTYTVAQPGIYLAGALVPYAANGTGIRTAGISVNGTIYWGPPSNGGSADLCSVPKTQMFSLNIGDTVQLATWQNSGGALGTATAAQARMFLVWLCAQGAPATVPGAPDPGFRWQSGTPGAALPGLMTQHLSQDLGFLVQRPYLLAYQSAAQSGLTQNAFSTVVLDQAKGIVHADAGDNYGGWTSGSSNNYAAVVPGWYLCAGEFFATESAASGASVIGAILPSTSGGFTPSVTPDWYQHQTATTNTGLGGGVTVLGLYYLEAGESLTPQIEAQSYTATFGTLAGTASSGQVNSQFGMVWISS